MKTSILSVMLLLVCLSFSAAGSVENKHLLAVQTILNSNVMPEGVVFEIVNRDKAYLDWALQEVADLSKQLHQKYPTLAIAVVSHGSEQFALMQSRLENNVSLHSLVRSLVKDDVEIHVCGTYAERKGIDASEFSPLVDVSAEGPAQINDYIKLGYIKIRIVKS